VKVEIRPLHFMLIVSLVGDHAFFHIALFGKRKIIDSLID
jgi:hypothetical protein